MNFKTNRNYSVHERGSPLLNEALFTLNFCSLTILLFKTIKTLA